MLALAILSTVFLGLSCVTAFSKNCILFSEDKYSVAKVLLWTLYGFAWRALAIVSIWILLNSSL